MNGSSDSNPFVGPRSLLRGELLYGRDDEVRDLCNRIQARRIVVMHSPSGAGKSSLVQAGVIPRLKEAGFDIWKPIRVNLDSTGMDVPKSTNRYLLSAMVSLEDELPEGHRRSPAELAKLDFAQYLETRPRRKGRAGRKLALIFDQFEEVFTTEPLAVDAKREFFATVGAALENRNYWALFALREDYLGQLVPYRDLIPTQLSNTFRLDLLGLRAAQEVAEKSAEQGNRSFPAAEQLIRDLSVVKVQQPDGTFVLQPGLHVEPVQLQVVCRQLWAAMPEDDRSIDVEDIERYGAVSASLAGYYDDTVGKIARGDVTVERAIREWIGSKLIVNGIRSQVRQETDQSAGLDNELIFHLLSSYLVRAEPRAGANWYELSHDRLVEPVLQDNKEWEQQNLHAVQLRARHWETGRRSRALLLNADVDDIADIQQWAQAHAKLLTESERDYLEQSRTQLDAERLLKWRRRALTTGAIAVAIVMAIIGLWAWSQRGKALDAKESAEHATEVAEKAKEEAEQARAVAEKATEAAEQASVQMKQAQQLAEDQQKLTAAALREALNVQRALFTAALRPAFIEELVKWQNMGAIEAPEWIPLYQFDNALFMAATNVGTGRILVAGSEAVLRIVDERRESLFLEIIVRWLLGERTRVIIISDEDPAPTLLKTLHKLGYDPPIVIEGRDAITAEMLDGAGALIIDNSSVPFEQAEIDLIQTFITNGGGVLAVGTGLAWADLIADYPMNQLLDKFGVKWTGKPIHVDVKTPQERLPPRVQALQASDVLTQKGKIERAAVSCQKKHESVNDSLRVKFKVKSSGMVTDAKIDPAGLPVGECVLARLEKLSFPRSYQGGAFTWTLQLQ